MARGLGTVIVVGGGSPWAESGLRDLRLGFRV